MLDGDDVRRAAASCCELLSQNVERSWDVAVPDLDFTVCELAAHISQCGIWYTIDLTAAGRELEVISPRVDSAGPSAQLTVAVDVCSEMLARSVDTAAATTRGFHPFGSPDPSGFAAMGCDEILVHAADIANAFGLTWQAEDDLASRVTQRLFPWAPEGYGPWETLLWCNGRVALADRPRLTRWRWQCAPLDEWDGVDPGSSRTRQGTEHR